MDNRYTWLAGQPAPQDRPRRRRTVILAIIDEIALFSTVLGTETQQDEFVRPAPDWSLAAAPRHARRRRHPAPSVDIIPTSLRDLFGYRAAFRCTTTGTSNIILGARLGRSRLLRHRHRPHQPGRGLPVRRRRHPPPIKAAYLTDSDIIAIADHAAWTRRASGLVTPSPTPAAAHVA